MRENGWDFFQGRVLWPIRDAGRSVLGFGARRIFDDDRMPAKYLNTPETLVYKKSHVLYGPVSYTHLDVYKRQPRDKVILPYGWLDSPQLGDADIAAAESDASGG